MSRWERERVCISQQDWSLQRKGPIDEQRLNEKVKEAIKDDLPTIISDGTIISVDPTTKKTIRIPLRSLELPRIRYTEGDEGMGRARETREM